MEFGQKTHPPFLHQAQICIYTFCTLCLSLYAFSSLSLIPSSGFTYIVFRLQGQSELMHLYQDIPKPHGSIIIQLALVWHLRFFFPKGALLQVFICVVGRSIRGSVSWYIKWEDDSGVDGFLALGRSS